MPEGANLSYRVMVGLDYKGKRAEPGEVVKDLPDKSVPWLLKQGLIEPVKKEEPDANV